ncbi:MAG: hypothetical protein LBL45_10985 [Treponema sp.]|jgi:hypothetical protein|nr:hypothetical protein [Treponema sp.]
MKNNHIKFLTGCLLCLSSLSFPALQAAADEIAVDEVSRDEPVVSVDGAAEARESAVLIFYHQGRENAPPDLYNAIDYVAYAVDAALYESGIEAKLPYVRSETGDFSSGELQRHCAEADVRWAITVYTTYGNDRLSWRFSIYDAVDNFIRASETFWTPFYVGLLTDASIDNSAEKLIQNYQQSFHTSIFSGDTAVSVPQKFTAPEDGIEVFFGDTDGVSAGVVKNKELVAPFLLFVEGKPIFGTAVKSGYWEQPFELAAGVTEESAALQKPLKKMRQSASFMTDLRGIPVTPLKYGVSLGYRFYPALDRWFFNAGYSLWQEKLPLNPDRGRLYQELRFGTGLYLLPDTKLPFRVLAGTGVSIVFVDNAANFLADPLWLGAEYHFSRFAIISEVRLPEIFTYSRNSFGSDVSDGGWCVSFGVMLKW